MLVFPPRTQTHAPSSAVHLPLEKVKVNHFYLIPRTAQPGNVFFLTLRRDLSLSEEVEKDEQVLGGDVSLEAAPCTTFH